MTDLRHAYATWSLEAGVDIFALARRRGTSVRVRKRAYGCLTENADGSKLLGGKNGRSNDLAPVETADLGERYLGAGRRALEQS